MRTTFPIDHSWVAGWRMIASMENSTISFRAGKGNRKRLPAGYRIILLLTEEYLMMLQSLKRLINHAPINYMTSRHFIVAKIVQKNIKCSWFECPYCNNKNMKTGFTIKLRLVSRRMAETANSGFTFMVRHISFSIRPLLSTLKSSARKINN